MNTHDIGDLVVLQGVFTSRALTTNERKTLRSSGTLPAGVGVTPADVVCTVEDPEGGVTTPAVSSEVDGIFTAEVAPDKAGAWQYAFDGEGGYQAAAEGRFSVRERQIER